MAGLTAAAGSSYQGGSKHQTINIITAPDLQAAAIRASREKLFVRKNIAKKYFGLTCRLADPLFPLHLKTNHGKPNPEMINFASFGRSGKGVLKR